MTVICTDTNAFLAGMPIPSGTYEWPLHGVQGVITSLGNVTNFNLGPGDTLWIWPGGAAMQAGVDPWQMFLAGLMVSWAGLGMIAFARRVARWFAPGVKEV